MTSHRNYDLTTALFIHGARAGINEGQGVVSVMTDLLEMLKETECEKWAQPDEIFDFIAAVASGQSDGSSLAYHLFVRALVEDIDTVSEKQALESVTDMCTECGPALENKTEDYKALMNEMYKDALERRAKNNVAA